jgi:uncharacterized membrane protein YedE/YeeE
MSSSAIVQSLAGGVLIGGASLGLLALTGRVAGVSGVVAGLISPRTTALAWRVAFLAGLVAGGLVAFAIAPSTIGAPLTGSAVVWAVGGVLVGIGARVGGGCTSGHGVCGIGRLSPRSMVATATFMATGAATVLAARLLGGVA